MIKRIVIVLVVLTISAVATAAPQYAITDLGTLGGEWCSPRAINNNGLIVGTAYVPTGYEADTEPRAVLLDSVSGQLNLRLFGDCFGSAKDINATGQVVGSFRDELYIDKAGLWEAEQGATMLPDFGGEVRAWGLNDLGQIVGRAEVPGTEYCHHAVFWDKNQVLKNLGTLGGALSEAYDINNAGLIIGSAAIPKTNDYDFNHAVIWDTDGNITDLGTLGGNYSYSMVVNDRGQVAGSAETSKRGEIHPFLWDQTNGMVDLGTVGSDIFWINGINNEGQMVGIIILPEYPDGGESFLYDDETGFVDLMTLLPEKSGWSRLGADDINDYGQIVGTGTINGESHAFLMTPIPEPMTVILLLAGLIGIQAKRRQYCLTTSRRRKAVSNRKINWRQSRRSCRNT